MIDPLNLLSAIALLEQKQAMIEKELWEGIVKMSSQRVPDVRPKGLNVIFSTEWYNKIYASLGASKPDWVGVNPLLPDNVFLLEQDDVED